jgi:hypothetical protein
MLSPRLLPLSRRSFLLLLPSPPPRLPLLWRFSSWHNREAGWLSLLSLRLPFAWLLLLRSRSSSDRLKELRLPLP